MVVLRGAEANVDTRRELRKTRRESDDVEPKGKNQPTRQQRKAHRGDDSTERLNAQRHSA